MTQTGPHTFDVPGTFIVRGISKAKSLTFTAEREGAGTGEIEGTLWFDRRDFELGASIPFVKNCLSSNTKLVSESDNAKPSPRRHATTSRGWDCTRQNR
jgi:polyisoprenoid-binding protein YceI